MTKEEILKKHWLNVTNMPFDDAIKCHLDYVLQAMQEYSDLQNKELIDKVKELQSQLAEKEKWYNKLLFRYDERSKGLSYYQKLSINLQSELTELKEKHTRDVVGFANFLKDYEYIMSLSLKYGAYVNKNEVDIYVNGSELHYQNIVLSHGKSIEQLYEQYYKQTHENE